MKKLQAIIKKPCSENWDKMTPNEQGRHCEKCALTVIDFTQMAEDEILQTLQARAGERTCGRMKVKPARYTLPEQIIHPQIQRYSWKLPHGLYTLSLAALLLSSCNYFPGNHVTGEVGQVEITGKVIRVDSLESPTVQDITDTLALFSQIDTGKKDSTRLVKTIKCPAPPIAPIDPIPDFMGDVALEPYPLEEPPMGKMVIHTTGEIAIDVDTPSFAAVMPEFPDGHDSLMAFIQKNIRFPKEGLAQEIQGRVVVMFVVSIEGKIMNARVVKSIPNAPFFDEEALRILSIMPDWIPAQNYDGKVIPIRMALPIHFKLE